MFNKRVLKKAVDELNKAKKPAKQKDIIVDPKGQWAHPGQITRIPSNKITMQGVGYPVLGVPNKGQPKMMMPGQYFEFPEADYVDEYPQMQDGGQIYTYAKRPGSYYKKDSKGNWMIKNESTHGKYVGIDDPKGTRSKVLNAQAKPLQKTPKVEETLVSEIKTIPKDNTFYDSTLQPGESTAVRNIIQKPMPDVIGKDTMTYLKEQKQKKEKAINKNIQAKNKKVKEFYKEYHESPRYNEMLSKSSPDKYEDYAAGRMINLEGYNDFNMSKPHLYIRHKQPKDDPGTGGFSLTDSGDITVLPQGFGVKGLLPHEWSHSTDRPIFLGINPFTGKNFKVPLHDRLIPKKDEQWITKNRAKTWFDSPEFMRQDPQVRKWDLQHKDDPYIQEYVKDQEKWYDYVGEPTETRARLNDIRFQSKQSRIYDPFTEKVTPAIFKKLLKTKFESKGNEGFDALQQLRELYTDEEIQWMLNNISKNQQAEEEGAQSFGRYGGQFQDGGEQGCPEGYAFNPKTGECIEWNPDIRESYDQPTSFDPVGDVINMNPNDRPEGMSDEEYAQMYQDQLEHEQLHRLQWKNDELKGESKTPLRMPSTVDNEDFGGDHYYNRRNEEVNYLHDYWKNHHPDEAAFIPDDVIYNYETDPAMYQLPWTVEGEARGYEYATHDGMESLFPKKQDGGQYRTKLTPEEEFDFQNFYRTLPDNLQTDDDTYDIRGYWDSEGRPGAFNYDQPKEKDGYYHAYSINQNTGEYLKSPAHDTFQHAVDEDRKIGYRPITNIQGRNIAVENQSIADPEEQSYLRNMEGPANYIELDLTPEEIQEYAKGGYIIEDVSVPSLTKAQKGGIFGRRKRRKEQEAQQQQPQYVAPVEVDDELYESVTPYARAPQDFKQGVGNIKEVGVAAKAPEWLKFSREYEDKNSRQAFIDGKKRDYLKHGLAKAAGLNMENFPEQVERNFEKAYDYKKNSYVMKKLSKTKGFSLKRRGEWVDQLTKPELQILADSKYESKLQPSIWARTNAGIRTLYDQIKGKQYSNLGRRETYEGMTEAESKAIQDQGLLGALNTFAIAEAPGYGIANLINRTGNLSYGSNYREMPNPFEEGELMSGVNQGQAALVNPVNYVLPYELMTLGAAGAAGLRNLFTKPVTEGVVGEFATVKPALTAGAEEATVAGINRPRRLMDVVETDPNAYRQVASGAIKPETLVSRIPENTAQNIYPTMEDIYARRGEFDIFTTPDDPNYPQVLSGSLGNETRLLPEASNTNLVIPDDANFGTPPWPDELYDKSYMESYDKLYDANPPAEYWEPRPWENTFTGVTADDLDYDYITQAYKDKAMNELNAGNITRRDIASPTDQFNVPPPETYYQPFDPNAGQQDLDELRRIYHTAERNLTPVEARALSQEGVGSLSDYMPENFGEDFDATDLGEHQARADANNVLIEKKDKLAKIDDHISWLDDEYKSLNLDQYSTAADIPEPIAKRATEIELEITRLTDQRNAKINPPAPAQRTPAFRIVNGQVISEELAFAKDVLQQQLGLPANADMPGMIQAVNRMDMTDPVRVDFEQALIGEGLDPNDIYAEARPSSTTVRHQLPVDRVDEIAENPFAGLRGEKSKSTAEISPFVAAQIDRTIVPGTNRSVADVLGSHTNPLDAVRDVRTFVQDGVITEFSGRDIMEALREEIRKMPVSGDEKKFLIKEAKRISNAPKSQAYTGSNVTEQEAANYALSMTQEEREAIRQQYGYTYQDIQNAASRWQNNSTVYDALVNQLYDDYRYMREHNMPNPNPRVFDFQTGTPSQSLLKKGELDNLPIPKKDMDLIKKTKYDLSTDNTTGIVDYHDVDDPRVHTVTDKNLIPKNEDLDDLISAYEKAYKEATGGLKDDLELQLEDLRSTKWLRTEYAEELKEAGLSASEIKNVSVVSNNSNVKNLIKGNGEVLGTLITNKSKLSSGESAVKIGSSGLAFRNHPYRVGGKHSKFKTWEGAQKHLEKKLFDKEMSTISNPADKKNPVVIKSLQKRAKTESDKIINQLKVNNENNFGEALYRGVHHGTKDTRGPIFTKQTFVPTNLPDAITGENINRKRAEHYWGSQQRQLHKFTGIPKAELLPVPDAYKNDPFYRQEIVIRRKLGGNTNKLNKFIR